jgi:uncharacterized membrane protein HdeD (DUF308 family)
MANARTAGTMAAGSPRRSGWIDFAGYLMVVAGTFHIIAGLTALFKDQVYVAAQSTLLAFDYTQWGWVHLIFGIILCLSAASLFANRFWGRFVAIFLATLSAIANFSFIWAYPLWSVMIIALDVMIIYAVATHGRDEYYA